MDDIEITKIERTDADVDNSRYEMKVAEIIKDDFDNEVVLYRKKSIDPVALTEEKATLQTRIGEIDKILLSVDKIIEVKK